MNGFQNTTIKVLAERLGVSKGTVSKALQDSHEISIATKTKILAVAKQLNYTPNHFASGLKSKKSKTLAVIVPAIVDSFFSLVINGIEAVARKKGYHINIYITNDLISKEQDIVQVLSDGRVDGVLISLCGEASNGKHIAKLIDHGIPLVFFDRVADDLEAAKIVTDDFNSGYIATRHLIEQGCKNIHFFSVSESLSILQERVGGFIRALDEGDHEDPVNNVYQIPMDEAESLDEIKLLLSDPLKRPDGIVLSVESLIIPLYRACRELNLVIPKEIKIICFSCLQYADFLSPSLSTVTQPAFEIGRQAADLICYSIDRNIQIESERIVCPSRLLIRESSCK